MTKGLLSGTANAAAGPVDSTVADAAGLSRAALRPARESPPHALRLQQGMRGPLVTAIV